MFDRAQAVFTADDGASLGEYALVLALVGVVALVALSALGKNASASLEAAADSIG